MISNLRLLIALIALGALPLWAQDNDDGGGGGDAVPGKYFRTIGAGVTANDLYFKVKGKDKNIGITDSIRSPLYDPKGVGKIVFYKIVTGPDGKPMHIEMAQAQIPKANSLTLLIFSANPATPGTYNVDVLPDDLVTFPLGSYRIFNRSTLPVKVVLGNQGASVAPNKIRVLMYQPPAGGGSVPVRIYTPTNNTPRLIYANTWGDDNNHRTDILVNPSPGTSGFIAIGRMLDNPTALLRKEYLPKD